MNIKIKRVLNITAMVFIVCAALVFAVMLKDILNNEIQYISILSSLLNIFIAVFGLLYVYTGATKKDSAYLFKDFVIVNAVTTFVLLVSMDLTKFGIGIYSITFAGYCVLSVALNLGEVKSKVIAGVIALNSIIGVVYRLITVSQTSAEIVSSIVNAIIPLCIYVLVWAKYEDKKSRGR